VNQNEQRGAIFETREDAGKGKSGVVKYWMEQINLSDKVEADWRKGAKSVIELYRSEKRRKSQFNILRSNINTLRPACYNSLPVPDIRRRWQTSGPVVKQAADALERTLSRNLDDGDFDDTMLASVQDYLLVGRGVARVRYAPVVSEVGGAEQVVDERVSLDCVNWEDFRRGPAKVWKRVPWIAFHHTMTRDELVEKFGDVGNKVELDVSQSVKDKADNEPVPDAMKRGRVWEIWDKDAREVVFVAPTHKDAPLKTISDPLRLEGFFPCPPPLYSNVDTTSLVPVPDYESYRDQAEELNRVTERITSLVKVLKWRGVYDASINEVGRLENAEDGEMIASSNVLALMQAGGLEGAIWLMPVERLIEIIRELYRSRAELIQTIYEITGISDILRGATNPNETLGAQQIKAQFGSNKLQERQRDVQNFARDAMRLLAELISEHFSPQTISQSADMMDIAPQALDLLRSDQFRGWRIDIETDSTIQADMSRTQQNIGEFIQGLAAFMQAIGPGVQSGDMPKDVAADMLAAFAKVFKLPKQAEDALERLGEQAKQQQDQPQQPSPQQQAEAQRAQLEAQKTQMEAQKLQVDAQAEAQRMQLDAEAAAAEHQLKLQEIARRQQEAEAKHEVTMMELALKAREVKMREAMPKKEIMQ